MRNGPSSRSGGRAVLHALSLLALLIALPVWLTWREVQQTRLDHALIVAVKARQTARMAALLHQGADPNARDVPERPLAWRDLLDRWLRRSVASGLADTVLMAAARTGNREGVDLLLHNGANPNAANVKHECPLSVALNAETVDVTLIQNLLIHGANPNIPIVDIDGDQPTSALFKIFEREFDTDEPHHPIGDKLVKLLLDRGADVRLTDKNGQTALLAAIGSRDAQVAHWLMERGADINRANDFGHTPLHDSVATVPILKELLRRGVDIAPAHNNGWDLLIWAAGEENLSVLQTALERGIPVNSCDKMQRTPLMYAAAHGNRRSLYLLLAHGAKVDAQDKNGWTALMFAAQNGDIATMCALLQQGANPRLRDHEHGWTAAHRAASVGQEQVAHWLSADAPLQKAPQTTPEWPWPAPASDDNDEPVDIPIRLRVDTHRSINITFSHQSLKYQAVIVGNRGRTGKPYRFVSANIPSLHVFADTNRRLYAWLFAPGNPDEYVTTGELMEIRGLDLIKRTERISSPFSYCQPMPGGGLLLVVVEISPRKNPVGHADDRVATVTRFRDGKLTDLGPVFIPRQE